MKPTSEKNNYENASTSFSTTEKQVEHEKATMSEATYIHLDVDLESLPCNEAFQHPDHLVRRLANLFGSHTEKVRQVRNIGIW